MITSTDFEKALIGSLIQEPHRIPDVFTDISADMFEDKACRAIADTMQKGTYTQKTLQNLGILAYDYESMAWQLGNYSALPKIVADFHRRRVIFNEAILLSSKVQNESLSVDLSYEQFIKATTTVSNVKAELQSAYDVKVEMESLPDVGRIYTGNRYFDTTHYRTGGSRRGQLEYILAITGHGKSQYTGLLESMYAKSGNNVLHFQFEDSKYSTMRVFNQYCLDEESEKRIYISDTCRNIQHIEMLMRRYSTSNRPDVVVVDYVQNVGCIGISDTRERVSEVSGRLRILAKEYDCFVIAVSQVARDKTRKGYDAFPQLQDGKESSQIEQDAFMVTAVFRPNMVDELKVGDRVKDMGDGYTLPKNSVWVRKRKDRSGELDTRPVLFEHTGLGLQLTDVESARTVNQVWKKEKDDVPF